MNNILTFVIRSIIVFITTLYDIVNYYVESQLPVKRRTELLFCRMISAGFHTPDGK